MQNVLNYLRRTLAEGEVLVRVGRSFRGLSASDVATAVSLDPATDGDLDIGTTSAHRWRTLRLATSLILSTGGQLVAGTNVLAGAIADKLNAAHLAIASQAVGDLLIASGTTTFARLADVATGQVFKSGGIGVVPAWGAIGGTTAATAPGATSDAFTGTGFATVGQVVTTTDNQTMLINACAGMWLISASQPPALILSNTAVTGAPAVLTVYGLAPSTNAETYKILRGASHTHSGTGLT